MKFYIFFVLLCFTASVCATESVAEPRTRRFTEEIERLPWLGVETGIDAPQSAADYCKKSTRFAYGQDLLIKHQNWLSFANSGGLFSGGVCWWHSRFTRNATHLAFYSPRKPKPNSSQAQKLISQIRSAKHVIEIPGFRNLSEFSKAYRVEIQRELEAWQRFDGFVLQRWLRGISGPSEQSPDFMRNDMDKLYAQVSGRGQVVFQMLQIPGVEAHAWLVIKMKKVARGYDLLVVDSNAPDASLVFKYRVGDGSFNYGSTHLYPYSDHQSQLNDYSRISKKFCEPLASR